jgi:hypothetical protein
VNRDSAPIGTTVGTRFVDHTVDDARPHHYSVHAYNNYCGDGLPSTEVVDSLHPLLEITTPMPDSLTSGIWYYIDGIHCSNVEMDSVFLSLSGGPYLFVRRIPGTATRDSIMFDDPGQNMPNSHLLVVSYRGTRRDSIVTPAFVAIRNAVDDISSLVPKDFFLDQNYPNPFNPSTSIRFGVPREANVTLEIFDVLGRKAATLVNETVQPGVHAVTWDCASCPSGMYIVRMKAGETLMLRKMLLMK